MTAPLADAIRAARRAADEARAATIQLQRVRAALRGLDLLALQRAPVRELPALPGDDLVEELGADEPEASGWEQRIASRRAWLVAASERLEPVASEAEARTQALFALQARQRELLDRPEHRGLRAQLTARYEEQRRLAGERASLEREVLQLETGLRTLELICGVLGAEAGRGAPPAREAQLAREALGSLGRVFDEIGVDLPLPEVTGRDVLGRVVRALGATREDLARRLEPLRRERDERRQRHEALTRSILDEMG